MAKRNVEAAAAAKARKQKIILIVCGVVLLGLAAIQGPKLMKQGGAAEAAPAATSTTQAATGATATTPVQPAAPSSTTASSEPAGSVAGVALPGAAVVHVTTGQLASFTLFEVKDPFVQQAGDASSGTDAGAAAATSTDSPAPTPTVSGSSTGPQGSTPPATPAPVAYATINLDGKPQQLKLKQQFPKGDPLFVLVSLGKKQAKIGVAGGSFDNGETVTLKLGRKLTLVNTATSVRYELKLVYRGSAPETIEGFSADKSQPATGDASASSTANVAATATP